MQILAILLFFLTFTAHAWHARGHMIVAAIAYQELTEEQQQSVSEILTQHPEYERQWKTDYQNLNENIEVGLFLFMRAGIWSDDISSNKHPDHQYNAAKWHYMNYELKFPYDGELIVSDQENVLDAIDLNLKKFKDPDTAMDQKAIGLCWLIHLVGDIHQPLHSTSLFSERFPDGDRGGNLYWIKPKGAVKLHFYWDGLMGRSTRMRNVINEATLIKKAYKKDNLATKLNPVFWSQESFKLAREKVYLDGELQGSIEKENAPPVPENYGKESKKVGEQQVALAGYRLAGIISHVYSSKSLTIFPCPDLEANQDIMRSVNNIKERLSNSRITWKEAEDPKCGYQLNSGEREIFIEGAMTDVDLWEEIKKFFEL